MNRSVFLALGMSLLSLPLPSASLSQAFTHSTPQQGIPFTDNFTLSSFDNSLGTLTAITILLSNNTIGNVIVFNLSGTQQNFTNATATIPETLTSIAGTLPSSVVAGPLSGTATQGVNTFSGLAGTSSATLNVVDLTSFSTTGVIPLSFSLTSGIASFAGNTNAPGGTMFFGGSATVGSVTTISYAYETANAAAPEPGTWSLVGISSLALIINLVRRGSVASFLNSKAGIASA